MGKSAPFSVKDEASVQSNRSQSFFDLFSLGVQVSGRSSEVDPRFALNAIITALIIFGTLVVCMVGEFGG